MRPNREPGYVEDRRHDGTSVATLGKPAYVPIKDDEEEEA